MNDIHLNPKDFNDKVIKADKPVMVDFFAEWCGPCRILGPVVEKLAAEYTDKINVYKVDIDQAPDIAGQYGISAVPTVLFFKNGSKVDQFTGSQPKENIEKIIKKHL
jgi:thioredoxin 1